jgi:hypothetical protein
LSPRAALVVAALALAAGCEKPCPPGRVTVEGVEVAIPTLAVGKRHTLELENLGTSETLKILFFDKGEASCHRSDYDAMIAVNKISGTVSWRGGARLDARVGRRRSSSPTTLELCVEEPTVIKGFPTKEKSTVVQGLFQAPLCTDGIPSR